MASSQLTASSISTRSVASFEGLRPSSVQFHSARHVRIGNPARRSFKALIVKATTVVAPKVYFHSFFVLILYKLRIESSVFCYYNVFLG